MDHTSETFISLNIAVLTVSDTSALETDTSGQYLVDQLQQEGQQLADRKIIPATLSDRDRAIQVLLIT